MKIHWLIYLAIAGAVFAIFEAYAIKTGRMTLTQFIRDVWCDKWWERVLLGGFLLWLFLHLTTGWV